MVSIDAFVLIWFFGLSDLTGFVYTGNLSRYFLTLGSITVYLLMAVTEEEV